MASPPSHGTQRPDPPVLLTPPPGAVVTVGPVVLDWADTSCATWYGAVVRQSLGQKATVYRKSGLVTSQAVVPPVARGTYIWSAWAWAAAAQWRAPLPCNSASPCLFLSERPGTTAPPMHWLLPPRASVAGQGIKCWCVWKETISTGKSAWRPPVSKAVCAPGL